MASAPLPPQVAVSRAKAFPGSRRGCAYSSGKRANVSVSFLPRQQPPRHLREPGHFSLSPSLNPRAPGSSSEDEAEVGPRERAPSAFTPPWPCHGTRLRGRLRAETCRVPSIRVEHASAPTSAVDAIGQPPLLDCTLSGEGGVEEWSSEGVHVFGTTATLTPADRRHRWPRRHRVSLAVSHQTLGDP